MASFPLRGIPLLEKIRRRTRHAWLLHAWLIVSLLLLPAGRLVRADEDPFNYTGTESSLAISVSAPQGATGMQPGESRQVIANVMFNTWEVWTDSVSGAIQIRNALSTAVVNASLAFSVSTGDGSVAAGSTETDGAGHGLAIFTSGSSASTLVVAALGATGTLAFTDPVIPEVWSWDHDESLVLAKITTAGSSDNMPGGATRTLTVRVDYSSWSVFTSNYDHREVRNFTTSPAIGAQIAWSAGGDGSVAPGATQTDENGQTTADFTMGAAGSLVRADVTYAGGSGSYATLSFTPPPSPGSGFTDGDGWEYDHTDVTITGVSLSVTGSTGNVGVGETRGITASVTGDSVEVWTRDGETDYRNQQYGVPLDGATVPFGASADGSITPGSGTTGNDGTTSATFTMGSQVSTVTASAGASSDSVTFGPVEEVWTSTGTVTDYSLSFGSDASLRSGVGTTLTASVSGDTYETSVSNLGNTKREWISGGPQSGVTVNFGAGSGSLSTASATTDASGLATVYFTMGAETASVTASAEGQSASVTLTYVPSDRQYVRRETTVSANLTADDTTTGLQTGANRNVTAHVEFDSWDVYDDGSRDNHSSGPANGATVYFYVTAGDGSVSTTSTSTGSDGNAGTGFTMGSQDSTVQANVSYLDLGTIYATLNFTHAHWDYYGTGASLSVSLSADDTTNTATANVTVTTWDVYTDGNGNYDNRNYSYNQPAGGASVNFSAGGNVTVVTQSATTDSAGNASTGYTCPPGGQGSITADASFMDSSASDTVSITAPGDSGEAPDLSISGEDYVLFSYNGKVSLDASGGRAPYPSDGNTYTEGTVYYIFTYANLNGIPASGVSDQSSNLLIDRDIGGRTTVTVELEQVWVPVGSGSSASPAGTVRTKSPASKKPVRVYIAKPTVVQYNSSIPDQNGPGGKMGFWLKHDVLDQDAEQMQKGGHKVYETLNFTVKIHCEQVPKSEREKGPTTIGGPNSPPIDTLTNSGTFYDFFGCQALDMANAYDISPEGVPVPFNGTVILEMFAKDHIYRLGPLGDSPKVEFEDYAFNRKVVYKLKKGTIDDGAAFTLISMTWVNL